MDIALLMLHAVVGLLFAGHGLQKLLGWFGGPGLDGTAGYLHSLGLRPARMHAVAAGTSELAGGLLLAAGVLVPAAALLVTAVMVTAALTEHRGKGVWVDNGGFELPLAYALIAFVLAAAGPGELSLDAALGLEVHGLGWAAGAAGLGAAGSVAALGLSRLAARTGPRLVGQE
jgi:putative oxidoreductase